MRKFTEIVSQVVGLLFLVMAAVLLFRPGGAGRVAVREFLNDRSASRSVRDNWEILAQTRYRVGPESDSVRLVVLTDYQCAFCRIFHHAEDSLLTLVPGTSIGYVHVPRPGDPVSRDAALAAICAERQGKFSVMHQALMRSTNWTTDPDWPGLASNVGLDVDAFSGCFSSPSTAEALASDQAWADRLKIRGTPVLLTQKNGLHLGAVSAAEAASWIDGQH